MTIDYLPLKRITALYAEEINQAIQRVVNSGWYLQGQELRSFEADYAAYCGARHCVGLANGLDALILSLQGYKELGRLREGDEVIVPANTYIATILAITENRLKPVLVEPRLETLQIDDALIEQAITPRTRAIMLVNLYGYQAYTKRIGDICRRYNLLLITDCAQSHGLPTAGTCAHSFYPGKNLGALADAGAVTTDDEELATVVRSLGNYGSSRKYVFDYKGRNSRLDEMSAAILSVKLRHLDADNRRRQEVADYYIANIRHPEILLPPRDGVHHIFPILTPRRDALQKHLADRGIGTMIHYPIPPHQQQCYKEWNSLSFPITERIHREELSLPIHQALSNKEVQQIASAVNDFA